MTMEQVEFLLHDSKPTCSKPTVNSTRLLLILFYMLLNVLLIYKYKLPVVLNNFLKLIINGSI